MSEILYVDDERPLLDIGKIFLEKNGFAVRTADSVSRALELIKTEHFDAIISDYQMPGIDGIEFLKIVRQYNPSIPFIIFTGKGREEIVIKAFENGADSYIQKGGDPKSQFVELSHKVQDAINICQSEEKFHESELRYRRLFESAQDGILILDKKGKIIDANPYILDLIGSTFEDIVNKQLFEIGLIRDINLAKNAFKELNTKGYIRYNYLPLKIKGGGCVEVEFVSNKYPVNHSEVIQCNIRDISQRTKAERDCAVNVKKYQILFDLFPFGVAVSDEKGNIIESNNMAENLLGLSKEEQGKRKIDSLEWTFIRPDGSPMPAEEYASVRALKENKIVSNAAAGIIKRDGKITWISVTATPIRMKGYGCVIVFDEIFKEKT